MTPIIQTILSITVASTVKNPFIIRSFLTPRDIIPRRDDRQRPLWNSVPPETGGSNGHGLSFFVA